MPPCRYYVIAALWRWQSPRPGATPSSPWQAAVILLQFDAVTFCLLFLLFLPSLYHGPLVWVDAQSPEDHRFWLHPWHWLYPAAAVLRSLFMRPDAWTVQHECSYWTGGGECSCDQEKDVMRLIIHSLRVLHPAHAALQQARHWLVSSLWARQHISTSHSVPLQHCLWMKTVLCLSTWPMLDNEKTLQEC